MNTVLIVVFILIVFAVLYYMSRNIEGFSPSVSPPKTAPSLGSASSTSGFKISNRKAPGEQNRVCEYQYWDCMCRVSKGIYSKEYCDRKRWMCNSAACMSPY